MRKNRRHDWRNLPPKKMIRSMSIYQVAVDWYELPPAGSDERNKLEAQFEKFWEGLTKNLIVDSRVVVPTPYSPNEFALYNQLIVREPEVSYVGINTTA